MIGHNPHSQRGAKPGHTPAEKWRGGDRCCAPGGMALRKNRWPIETFHKVVSFAIGCGVNLENSRSTA